MNSQIGDLVICGDHLFRQSLPLRSVFKCIHRQTKQKYLIKIWDAKADQPVSTKIVDLDYKALFDNEINVLKRLGQTPLSKYLPELVAENPSATLVTPDGNKSIAYQLFQPIKFRPLFKYGLKVLGEPLSQHLLRQIIQFVIALNIQHSLSVFDLHPDHIFIDENLMPRFLSLMNVRPLNYSDQLGSALNINKEFRSPEILQNKRFNNQRADSFQLGVLACWMMCGAPCSETQCSPMDRLYGKVWYEKYADFWKWLKAANKSESLKDMILSLIQPEEQRRIDPYVIKNLDWWNEPCQAPLPNTLQVIEAEAQNKKKAELQLTRNTVLRRKKVLTGTREHFRPQRSDSSGSGQAQTQIPYYTDDSFIGCYFYPQRIRTTYRMLKQKCNREFILKREDQGKYRLIVESEDNGNVFLMQISLYALRESPGLTVVRYSVYQGEKLYVDEKYKQIITLMEARDEDQ